MAVVETRLVFHTHPSLRLQGPRRSLFTDKHFPVLLRGPRSSLVSIIRLCCNPAPPERRRADTQAVLRDFTKSFDDYFGLLFFFLSFKSQRTPGNDKQNYIVC